MPSKFVISPSQTDIYVDDFLYSSSPNSIDIEQMDAIEFAPYYLGTGVWE